MAVQVSTPTRIFRAPWFVLLLIGVLLLATLTAIVAWNALNDDTSDRTGITLTNADNNSAVSVALGEEIVIRIASNPTTGYEWQVGAADSAVLTYLGSEYETPDTNLVGAGGTQVLRFKAAGRGESTLALKYWRPFEGETSVVDEYVVTITVTDD